MNFWKTFSYKWGEEELKKWSSLKRTAYLLLPLFVYFGVHDIVEVILWMLLQVLVTNGGEGMSYAFIRYNATFQGVIYGLSILAGVAVIWPGVKREISRPEAGDGNPLAKNQNSGAGSSYFFLAALAFCTAVSLNIFFTQTGFTGSSEAYEEVYEMQYGVQFAVGLVLYGVLSPLAEEGVFRGLIYNRMKRCFRYDIALVVSSLLFGIYHGNMVQAVYGSILGLLIAYTYELYKSFAAPVLFHGVANVSVYVMTYNANLADMGRGIALTLGGVLLAAAVLIFFYIKSRKQKQ